MHSFLKWLLGQLIIEIVERTVQFPILLSYPRQELSVVEGVLSPGSWLCLVGLLWDRLPLRTSARAAWEVSHKQLMPAQSETAELSFNAKSPLNIRPFSFHHLASYTVALSSSVVCCRPVFPTP